MFGPEHEAALKPTMRERSRHVGGVHWAQGRRWVTYEPGGEDWMGFESIAVRRGDGWLLDCGDAYFNHREARPGPRRDRLSRLRT